MIKTIVSNIKELKKPCILVEEEEDISFIIQDLKDTLFTKKGYGLSANQIGYGKQVAYIKIGNKEIVLVNPVILEKEEKIINRGEGCLSFNNIRIDTDRWNQITIQVDRNDYKQYVCHGLEAIVMQHEIDHLRGLTIFDKKHKGK